MTTDGGGIVHALAWLGAETGRVADQAPVYLEPFVTIGNTFVAGLLVLVSIWLKHRFDRIDATATDLEPGVTSLVTKLEDIKAKVTNVDTKVDAMAETVDRNSLRITALAGWLTHLDPDPFDPDDTRRTDT